MSTYCIGDVHGCYRKLNQLLDKIALNATDQLWFTGDLINRGEDTLGVLRLVKKHRNFKVVLGNHELYWLAGYYCPHLFNFKELALPTNEREELVNWIASWPFYYQNDHYVLTHAGFFPFWSLTEGLQYFERLTQTLRTAKLETFLPTLFSKEQTVLAYATSNLFIAETLVRMRFCSRFKQLNLELTGHPKEQASALWRPWFDFLPLTFPKTILFGHWAALNAEVNHPRVIALDTGCVWGGKLTAYCLETKKFYHV